MPKIKVKNKGQKKSKKLKESDGKRIIIKKKRNQKKLIFFGILLAINLWLFWGVPIPTKLASTTVPVSTKLFDRNGRLIFEIYTDRKSTPVDIKELPNYVIQTTLAIEDKDFYK